jgi:hypothetical protein
VSDATKNGKEYLMKKYTIEIMEAEEVISLEEEGEKVTIESYDLVIGEDLIATVYDRGNAQRIVEMLNESGIEIEIYEEEEIPA